MEKLSFVKECPYCHAATSLLKPQCNACFKISLKRCEHNKKIAKEFIEIMEAGEYTLRAIGKQYGYSYERVRQLYKIFTGKNYQVYRKNKSIKVKQAFQAEMNRVKFICANCKITVTNQNGYDSHKYCNKCSKQVMRKGRNLNVLLKCVRCKKEYHPYRSSYSPNRQISRFCSKECYFDRYKDLQFYGVYKKTLELRPKKAQKDNHKTP